MNKKVLIWTLTIIFAIISVFIIFKITNTKDKKVDENEATKNIVEISNISKDSEDSKNSSKIESSNFSEISNEEVTDECLDEWNDYIEYMSERVEAASNNIAEDSTHYLLKDVYGHIEVYYLDENNDEYLYKKTSISTEYLSEEDLDDLQVGIEVVGIEALNKMLEDFE